MAADRNNDRVGICLFTSRVEKFVPPAKGRTHVLRLIRDLMYTLPEEKASDARPALAFLNHSLRRRSIVFLVTDGISLPAMERELRITAARHDLILVLVEDPRETTMPDVGLIELEDPETGEETIWDTSDPASVANFMDEAQRSRAELLARAKRLGIDVIRLNAGESVIRPICRLFAEREKRAASGG